MKYTLWDFNKDFPTEKSCLNTIFTQKYSLDCPCGGRFYRLRNRKVYSCSTCRKQISPTAGTAFHKSRTPLKKWFYALYLFSQSKTGISGAQLRRHLGVTEKCAWRMGHQIRKLMKQDSKKLKGVVEGDEAYIGGRKQEMWGGKGKTMVMGFVERGGRARANILGLKQNHLVKGLMRKHIKMGTTFYSDMDGAYYHSPKWGYVHSAVNHGRKEYARGPVHTNTIENFWGQLKRSIRGTHVAVSKKYLQCYVDNLIWTYDRRHDVSSAFSDLVMRI